MTGIRTPDGREIVKAEPADAEIDELEADWLPWLDREIAFARKLDRIQEKHAYFFEGAASTIELAAQIGYDGYRAMDLLDLGRALRAEPRVEELLRAKRLVFQAACALGKILPHPQYLREGDDWLHYAQSNSLRDLRRRIARTIEQIKREQKPLRPYTILVDDIQEYDLDRCHEVVKQREKNHLLTRGETHGIVAREWLLENDPVEKAVGERRAGPTAERPCDRYVPRAVASAIYRRASGMCEVGGCLNAIDELCHIKPHASFRDGEGSGREERDLFGACFDHHKLYDARPQYLMFLEWSAEGRPVFYNRKQRLIRPAPRPQRVVEVPEAWIQRCVETGAQAAALPEPVAEPAPRRGPPTDPAPSEPPKTETPSAPTHEAPPRAQPTSEPSRTSPTPYPPPKAPYVVRDRLRNGPDRTRDRRWHAPPRGRAPDFEFVALSRGRHARGPPRARRLSGKGRREGAETEARADDRRESRHRRG